MRKITIVALSLLVLASCEKLKKLADIRFSVPYSASVTVDGLPDNPVIPPVGLKASIPPIGIETKSEEYITQYNTSSELVTNVQLSQLTMAVNEPQNLDLVDSLWLYVSGPGLPEILAAHYYDIPKGIVSVDMFTDETNLKEYFLRDSMFFRIEGYFNSTPDSGSVFTFSSKFDITANPLN